MKETIDTYSGPTARPDLPNIRVSYHMAEPLIIPVLSHSINMEKSG